MSRRNGRRRGRLGDVRFGDGRRRGDDVRGLADEVGDRLLLFATSGRALVLTADPALEEITRMELGELVHASPAILNGRLYVRGNEHLYAIGPAGLPGTVGSATNSDGN